MCKKFVGLGVLGAVAAFGLLSTGAWSYVKTGYNSASHAMKESVPIDWEIKRARDMIESINPEIDRSRAMVAREEVQVARLAKEIQGKETLLVKSQKDIIRLKEDLQTGATRFVYLDRSYSKEQVQDDLASRFEQFKKHEETTKKLSQILSAREKNLSAARRKLDEMLSAKRELEVEIENLQARMTMVEVAKTSNPIELDDSQLSRTRQLIDDIAIRIDIEERSTASEGALAGNIQLDGEANSPELLDEIADYFNGTSPEDPQVVLTSDH